MLTPEQADQVRKQILEQLSKLPSEQVGNLKSQIENATPEQLEKFISQEGGEDKCIFCEIAAGNIETVKVFEDTAIFVMMDINPANLGHVMIIPKQHYQFIFQIPDEVLWDIVRTAKMIIPSLVNIVKAKGFNILISQGNAAQQRVNHFSLNIIPRFDDDKIQLGWERKQMMDEQKEVAKKLIEIFAKVVEEDAARKGSVAQNIRSEAQPAAKTESKQPEQKEEQKFQEFPRRMP